VANQGRLVGEDDPRPLPVSLRDEAFDAFLAVMGDDEIGLPVTRFPVDVLAAVDRDRDAGLALETR
jgi:hypothetical protein